MPLVWDRISCAPGDSVRRAAALSSVDSIRWYLLSARAHRQSTPESCAMSTNGVSIATVATACAVHGQFRSTRLVAVVFRDQQMFLNPLPKGMPPYTKAESPASRQPRERSVHLRRARCDERKRPVPGMRGTRRFAPGRSDSVLGF